MYPSAISVSASAKDLINKILITDPLRRIGLDDILEHEFMRISEEIPRNLPSSTLAATFAPRGHSRLLFFSCFPSACNKCCTKVLFFLRDNHEGKSRRISFFPPSSDTKDSFPLSLLFMVCTHFGSFLSIPDC